MSARARGAILMAFRDQRRRPLLLILLVVVPAYTITRSIAITLSEPRRLDLPGQITIITTMKDVHGAVMAGIAVAFVAAIVGVFVMQSALAGDRRLVIAGFRPAEVIVARMAVLATATALVVGVAAAVTALSFTPADWPPLVAALATVGLIYAALGALAGAMLDRLAASYLVLFIVMTDLGIVQNPMFGDGTPAVWGRALPGWGPGRAMVDSAFSANFHAAGELLVGTGWLAALGFAVFVVLRGRVGAKSARSRR